MILWMEELVKIILINAFPTDDLYNSLYLKPAFWIYFSFPAGVWKIYDKFPVMGLLLSEGLQKQRYRPSGGLLDHPLTDTGWHVLRRRNRRFSLSYCHSGI